MARHPASRKGAGGGRGGAQSRLGRPADSHAHDTHLGAAGEASTAADTAEAVIDQPAGDPEGEPADLDVDPVAAGTEPEADESDESEPAAEAETQPDGEGEAEANQTDDKAGSTAEPEPDLEPLTPASPRAEPQTTPRAAAALDVPDVPGLEPLISLVQTAIVEIDAALQRGSDVRVSLTALASGVPGDDREVIGFLRRSLAPAQDRLLSVLAGLSEERRALNSASVDLDRIYTRRAYDAADGLARIAEATAGFRTGPVPVIAVRVGPPPVAAVQAVPVLVPVLVPVQATERVPPPVAGDDDDTPQSPGSPPIAEGDRDGGPGHAGGHGHPGGTSAVSRLAGALRRSAGQALGVYQVGDPVDRTVDPDAESGDTTPDGAEAEAPAASGRARSARASAMPVRRTAKYAALIGVPALFFSGLGGVPPRVDAVPAPATPIAQVVATMAPTLAPTPASTALPGVDNANEVPLGDDSTSVLPFVGMPDGSPEPGTIDGNGADPTTLPSIGPSTIIDGAVVSYRGPTTRRVVALTFDDGYSTPALKRIYATLVANDVVATFFVNGIYLSRSPQTWKQIAGAGFAVGNHTYHHVDIRHLTPAQLSKELAMTASAWRKITGTELIPYFRPPYGAHSRSADAIVAADGYPNIVLWSNSVADTSSSTTVNTGTAAALRAGPGGIVLMHIGPALTPELLQGVIDGFRARGFTFVTIPELLSR
jgi:peptidoglycan/xylan/chitin deacetylase (PgdA/CDA1 family)